MSPDIGETTFPVGKNKYIQKPLSQRSNNHFSIVPML